MGDNNLSAELEAFDDLWALEDSNLVTAPYSILQNQSNPCREFGFTSYLEQGISQLAETFSISNETQETNAIDCQQDGSLCALLEASDDTPYMLAEQEYNIFQNNNSSEMDSNMLVEQDNIRMANLSSREIQIGEQENITMSSFGSGEGPLGKGSNSKKIGRRSKTNAIEKRAVSNDVEGGLSAILAKKQDHNAKERIRRMKLRASYVALGSSLPKSRRSKKRWTASVIIDKVHEYIPELEKEIQKLTIKKKKILSVIENRSLHVDKKKDTEVEATLTVSINEIRKGELVLQVCRKRDETNNVFSNLLQTIEDEGICIVSASTIHVCEERECYHIHIQIKESSSSANGCDYITALKEKVVSWLST